MIVNHKKYSLGKVLSAYLITIILTLIVTLASIFTFTFTLAPRFKGLTSVLLFLIIPILYLAVFIYANKKIKRAYIHVNDKMQFRFDLIKQVMVYIILMLMLFFLFLLSLYFPLQHRGTNDTPYNLTIQPYVLSETEKLYNESALLEANKIYSKYNFTIHLNNPKKLNIELNESDKQLIFSQNCSMIDYIYNLTDKDNQSIKLILLNYNGSTNGMANFCGKGDLIVISLNNNMQGWVLAHETGHILSAKIECWRYNLMKEYSRECYAANWMTHDFIRDLKPDFLNQNQVNAMVNTIKSKFAN